MPITKFTASADTTIVNAYYPNSLARAFLANIGAADSLEMFSIYISGSETQKARILLNFPINEISQSRANGTIPTSGSVNFFLKLYNVEHPETLSTKYFASVSPISSSWDEGFGLDLENYSDTGQSASVGYGSNWIYRSTTDVTQSWNSLGGDIIPNYEKLFYFNNGLEDLSVDITDIIEKQISNILPSYGFMIKLSGAYEDGTNETTYYTKRFSARSSEYFYKVPSIEAVWESTVKDDRGEFFYNSPNLSSTDNIQNIYFYNKISGKLKDLPNSIIPLVKIYDEDNNFLTGNINSTKVKTGVYKASFSITGTQEQNLIDVWYSGSNFYYSGILNAKNRIFSDSETEDEYVLALTNLKKEYDTKEKPLIKIFARQKDWSPNIYKIANSEINTLIFNNLYYKIVRIVDNKTIIDYGISPIAYTLCSYDKNGNYFELDMNMLEPGYSYGIKFMLVNDDSRTELKEIFKFKVI